MTDIREIVGTVLCILTVYFAATTQLLYAILAFLAILSIIISAFFFPINSDVIKEKVKRDVV